MFEELKKRNFEILTLHHAEAILSHDLNESVSEIEESLLKLNLPVEELILGGGGESKMTQRLRKSLSEKGWRKHNFEIKKVVDGIEKESRSHEIDHVKQFQNGTFALEIEWNNKDPFYDRDLENFKRLHAEGVISVGCIITRGKSLHESIRGFVEKFAEGNAISSLKDLSQFYTPTSRQEKLITKKAESENSFAKGWASTFVADKFGQATTHWQKLYDRVNRGVGNPCPLVLIGLPADIVSF